MTNRQILTNTIKQLDLRFLYRNEEAAKLPRQLAAHNNSPAEVLHCEACQRVSAEFCEFIQQAHQQRSSI